MLLLLTGPEFRKARGVRPMHDAGVRLGEKDPTTAPRSPHDIPHRERAPASINCDVDLITARVFIDKKTRTERTTVVRRSYRPNSELVEHPTIQRADVEKHDQDGAVRHYHGTPHVIIEIVHQDLNWCREASAAVL
ncbi:MAG: hypothetical protein ACRD2X_27590 [Vicinamibacteraceae bacterium]